MITHTHTNTNTHLLPSTNIHFDISLVISKPYKLDWKKGNIDNDYRLI